MSVQHRVNQLQLKFDVITPFAFLHHMHQIHMLHVNKENQKYYISDLNFTLLD